MFTVCYTLVPTCLLCSTLLHLHVYCVLHLCTYMFTVYYTLVPTCLLCTTLVYLHVYCVLHLRTYKFTVCYTLVPTCLLCSMPEYLEKRYGGQRLRIAMSVISMILYVMTKIAVDMYAGALFIQIALGINLYLAVGRLCNNEGTFHSLCNCDFIQMQLPCWSSRQFTPFWVDLKQ